MFSLIPRARRLDICFSRWADLADFSPDTAVSSTSGTLLPMARREANFHERWKQEVFERAFEENRSLQGNRIGESNGPMRLLCGRLQNTRAQYRDSLRYICCTPRAERLIENGSWGTHTCIVYSCSNGVCGQPLVVRQMRSCTSPRTSAWSQSSPES